MDVNSDHQYMDVNSDNQDMDVNFDHQDMDGYRLKTHFKSY